VFCLNRRLSIRIRLSRITNRLAISKGDLPKTFIDEEFLRSCAIAYSAIPEVTFREGWGTPESTMAFDFVWRLWTPSPQSVRRNTYLFNSSPPIFRPKRLLKNHSVLYEAESNLRTHVYSRSRNSFLKMSSAMQVKLRQISFFTHRCSAIKYNPTNAENNVSSFCSVKNGDSPYESFSRNQFRSLAQLSFSVLWLV